MTREATDPTRKIGQSSPYVFLKKVVKPEHFDISSMLDNDKAVFHEDWRRRFIAANIIAILHHHFDNEWKKFTLEFYMDHHPLPCKLNDEGALLEELVEDGWLDRDGDFYEVNEVFIRKFASFIR